MLTARICLSHFEKVFINIYYLELAKVKTEQIFDRIFWEDKWISE